MANFFCFGPLYCFLHHNFLVMLPVSFHIRDFVPLKESFLIFQELLGMTKDEFSALPTWKQTKLKKDVGLF